MPLDKAFALDAFTVFIAAVIYVLFENIAFTTM